MTPLSLHPDYQLDHKMVIFSHMICTSEIGVTFFTVSSFPIIAIHCDEEGTVGVATIVKNIAFFAYVNMFHQSKH